MEEISSFEEQDSEEYTAKSIEKSYDIGVVGAGIAGVLIFNRIKCLLPKARVALFEADAIPGGRRRLSPSIVGSPQYRSYGLNQLSAQLLNFCYELHKQAHIENVKLGPVFDDFHAPVLSFLTGGKLIEKEGYQELISEELIKKLGGGAAGSQFKAYLGKIAEQAEQEGVLGQPLAKLWPGTRKDAALQIIEKILIYYGCCEFWNMSGGSLDFFISQGTSDQRYGDVSALCSGLLKDYDENLECCFFNARVFSASLNKNKLWDLNIGGQTTQCRSIVSCHSPWDTLKWLNKDDCPGEVLQLAAKVQPTSLVSLSTVISQPSEENLPDVCLVVSEDAHAVKSGSGEIVFRTAIPYEHSLQAPAVLKAIKALKRAQKKFMGQLPSLDLTSEHVALLTGAWTVSHASVDRKYYERMEKQKFQSEQLLFVGDAYGEGIDGDANIIKSLLLVSAKLFEIYGN